MKVTGIIKPATLLIFSMLTGIGFSQETDTTNIPGKPQDCVINTKMIEKFYATYERVEVISWQEVLMENSFEDAKNYLNAYINLNLNEVEPENLKQAINIQVESVKENMQSGLEKKYPIASTN